MRRSRCCSSRWFARCVDPASSQAWRDIAFAVHPVRAEAVTGMRRAARKRLLAAFFVLISLLCHRHAVITGQWVYRLSTRSLSPARCCRRKARSRCSSSHPVMDALFPRRASNGQPSRDPISHRQWLCAAPGRRARVSRGSTCCIRQHHDIQEGVIAPLDNPLVKDLDVALGERLGLHGESGADDAVCGGGRVRQTASFWPARLSPDYS